MTHFVDLSSIDDRLPPMRENSSFCEKKKFILRHAKRFNASNLISLQKRITVKYTNWKWKHERSFCDLKETCRSVIWGEWMKFDLEITYIWRLNVGLKCIHWKYWSEVFEELWQIITQEACLDCNALTYLRKISYSRITVDMVTSINIWNFFFVECR